MVFMVIRVTWARLSMLLMQVNNVIMVIRYRFFRFKRVIIYVNDTRRFIVIMVMAIIKLIMFFK